MRADLGKFQFHDGEDRGEVERSVEMRKYSAAARRLPFQIIAEAIGVDLKQHQAGLPREMLVERAAQLMSCGEMDKAIAAIVGRALEATLAHGLRESGFGAN